MTRSAISLSPRTVIIDYGEVISHSPSAADRAALEELAGVDREKFWAAYWAHRPALDLAVEGVREYWAAIKADTGAGWDDGRVCQLWLADFRGWLSVNPAVIDVLADLRAGGTRLALLSNAAPDFGSFFRHGILGEYLDAVYVSGELKLLKPGAEIYRHVLGDLGIAASEAVFIDNRADNVRGAQEIGITGHVFTGAAALRAFLESFAAGSLPPAHPPPGVPDLRYQRRLEGKLTTAHDFTATTAAGENVPLRDYAGKVLLIVNVASKCGLTPQYEGLEALYRASKDQGLQVLGFPCNQFRGQEPGTDAEIQEFCQTAYDVTFPVFAKIDVNGPEASPLYEYLKAQAPGDWGPHHGRFYEVISEIHPPQAPDAVKWNFTKFLIARDGAVIKRYEPPVLPEEIQADLENYL